MLNGFIGKFLFNRKQGHLLLSVDGRGQNQIFLCAVVDVGVRLVDVWGIPAGKQNVLVALVDQPQFGSLGDVSPVVGSHVGPVDVF